MEQDRNERIVYLKDLFFVALYKWRSILVFGLVLAVLLGGMAFLSQKRATQQYSAEEVEMMLKQYQQTQQRFDERIENLKVQIQGYEEYSQGSVFMHINPYGVYKAEMALIIQTDYKIMPGMSYQNPDNTQEIMDAYQAYLHGDAVMQAIAQEQQIPAKYLSELIQIEGEGETRTLKISVVHTAGEDAQAILKGLQIQIQKAQAEIENNVASHTMQIVVGDAGERVDLEISKKQQLVRDEIENLKDNLEALEEERSELTAPSVGESFSRKKVLKDAFIGAFLGMALVVGVAWFMHIAGGKIYSVRTLVNATGVRVLGATAILGKTNKIDSWLRKMEGRAIKDNTQLLCEDVQNRFHQSRLLITGSAEKDLPLKIAEELSQAGVEAVYQGDILKDAAAMAALRNCDGVVLVEVCGHTYYRDVKHAKEVIQASGKSLIGCVLLGG